MNILILVSSLNFGGAEKQAVIDANLLSDKYNVFIMAFEDGPLRSILNENVTCVVLQKAGYISTAKKLSKFLRDNNIELIHSSLFAPMIISSIAGTLANVPVYWHFHSHEYDIPLHSKLAFIVAARFPAIKKISFVNRELIDYLKKRFFLPDDKLLLLYNSTGLTIERTDAKADAPVIIGFVGRVIKLKRVQFLIEIAEYLKSKKVENFQILIVGDGDEKDRLLSLAKEKQLSDKVIFVGFKNNIEDYYRIFDLFVMPSEEECLSIALIDSGIAGMPAVAFDVGGNCEIVKNGSTGFIVNSLDELKEKTFELVMDKVLREMMGQNAKEYCVNTFGHEKRIENLVKITQSEIA